MRQKRNTNAQTNIIDRRQISIKQVMQRRQELLGNFNKIKVERSLTKRMGISLLI